MADILHPQEMFAGSIYECIGTIWIICEGITWDNLVKTALKTVSSM